MRLREAYQKGRKISSLEIKIVKGINYNMEDANIIFLFREVKCLLLN
jgi:hypothetical protein